MVQKEWERYKQIGMFIALLACLAGLAYSWRSFPPEADLSVDSPSSSDEARRAMEEEEQRALVILGTLPTGMDGTINVTHGEYTYRVQVRKAAPSKEMRIQMAVDLVRRGGEDENREKMEKARVALAALGSALSPVLVEPNGTKHSSCSRSITYGGIGIGSVGGTFTFDSLSPDLPIARCDVALSERMESEMLKPMKNGEKAELKSVSASDMPTSGSAASGKPPMADDTEWKTLAVFPDAKDGKTSVMLGDRTYEILFRKTEMSGEEGGVRFTDMCRIIEINMPYRSGNRSNYDEDMEALHKLSSNIWLWVVDENGGKHRAVHCSGSGTMRSICNGYWGFPTLPPGSKITQCELRLRKNYQPKPSESPNPEGK